MCVVWVWAYLIKNAGVVDIFWSFNFTIIAAILYFMADGYWLRKILICSMVAVWSLRLGIYLLERVGSHLDEEEGRYKRMRNEWGTSADKKLFWFFQMQAISNLYLAIPFFLVAYNKKPGLTLLEVTGAIVWLLSILGESIADVQLNRFKRNIANKGKVCDVGLWYYSRHPNYFFESMIWTGYFLVAVGAEYGWLALLSPLTILLLLFRVTGIPLTEQQAVSSKGNAYIEYQKTTSVFIPWFKKIINN